MSNRTNLDNLPRSVKEARENGSKHYFTGKPCKYGHIDFRYTDSKCCAECSRLKCKKWREENPDKFTESLRSWRERNPERIKEYSYEYWRRDLEENKKKDKQKKEKHKDRIREYSKKYRRDNKEEIRAREKKYRRINKQKVLFWNSNRRAQKRNAVPSWIDQELVELIYQECPEGCEVDHYYPIVSDVVCGLHVQDNLQYLPVSINRSKLNKMPEEGDFRRY